MTVSHLPWKSDLLLPSAADLRVFLESLRSINFCRPEVVLRVYLDLTLAHTYDYCTSSARSTNCFVTQWQHLSGKKIVLLCPKAEVHFWEVKVALRGYTFFSCMKHPNRPNPACTGTVLYICYHLLSHCIHRQQEGFDPGGPPMIQNPSLQYQTLGNSHQFTKSWLQYSFAKAKGELR